MNHSPNIIDNVNGFQLAFAIMAFTIMAFTISLLKSLSYLIPVSSLSKHSWPSLSLFLLCSCKTLCFRSTLGLSPSTEVDKLSRVHKSGAGGAGGAARSSTWKHPPGRQGGCWVDWLLCWVICWLVFGPFHPTSRGEPCTASAFKVPCENSKIRI